MVMLTDFSSSLHCHAVSSLGSQDRDLHRYLWICTRSHVFQRGVDYGAHLIGRCLDWERSRRLRSTTHWLVWDVFSELNDWALILAKAAEELKHKVRFS
jgi:hypothetical protein